MPPAYPGRPLHCCSAHAHARPIVSLAFSCCSRRWHALLCLCTQPHLPALSVCQFGDACLYPLSFPRWASHGGVGCYSFKRPPAPSCRSISATWERVSSRIVLSELTFATWHILGPGPFLWSPPALSSLPHWVRLFNQLQAASFEFLTLDTQETCARIGCVVQDDAPLAPHRGRVPFISSRGGDFVPSGIV